MKLNKIVSREEWMDARMAFLAKEKVFTRLRDQLNRDRRTLPWVKVDKAYTFDTPNGTKSLAELFGDQSQLLVYHFMLGPDWKNACKSCSFWADNFNGIDIHLKQRDVSMVVISRAPLEQINTWKERMGWNFTWVSSFSTDFNYDYYVSFTEKEVEEGHCFFNFKLGTFPVSEAPGVSVFAKDEEGTVYHTYSCYARGLDMLNGAYNYLDLVPKGRDESDLSYSMAWLRLHDEYENND